MEKIIVLDCGSQYTQLIARKIRELSVCCYIYPYNFYPEIDDKIKGIIISGGPQSANDASAPQIDLLAFGTIPILGICYGAQYIANWFGGTVLSSSKREYGRANLVNHNSTSKLLAGINKTPTVWMSHGDTITAPPSDSLILAGSDNVKIAAFKMKDKNIYGLQFHPEVHHTTCGKQVLENFVFSICKTLPEWRVRWCLPFPEVWTPLFRQLF